MKHPFLLVDAFVGDKALGNQAGIVLLDGPGDAVWMQSVAAEINQAETAFLYSLGERWSLRWFTPAVEVDLCGHATLAATRALSHWGRIGGEVEFETLSGVLKCSISSDGLISMDFPSRVPMDGALHESLSGVSAGAVWTGETPTFWMFELPSVADLVALEPDYRRIGESGKVGIIATARGDAEDFVSRFFAPQSGIDEDPVTGSAHCALAPYWSAKLGKNRMVGRQLSPRGGVVEVELSGDRVQLIGRCRIAVEGTLLV